MKAMLNDHKNNVIYRKTPLKVHIGGIVIGFVLGVFSYSWLLSTIIIK